MSAAWWVVYQFPGCWQVGVRCVPAGIDLLMMFGSGPKAAKVLSVHDTAGAADERRHALETMMETEP